MSMIHWRVELPFSHLVPDLYILVNLWSKHLLFLVQSQECTVQDLGKLQYRSVHYSTRPRRTLVEESTVQSLGELYSIGVYSTVQDLGVIYIIVVYSMVQDLGELQYRSVQYRAQKSYIVQECTVQGLDELQYSSVQCITVKDLG